MSLLFATSTLYSRFKHIRSSFVAGYHAVILGVKPTACQNFKSSLLPLYTPGVKFCDMEGWVGMKEVSSHVQHLLKR